MLKMLFLNIRSLRNKLDDLKITIKNNSPDIVSLNEVWITSYEQQFFKIEGFEEVINTRDSDKGGGCAIYVRKGINMNLIKTTMDFNSILLEVSVQDLKFHLLTCYRPPDSNHSVFMDFLESYLERGKLFIMCDSNINLLQNCNVSKRYLDLIKSYGFQLLNTIHPSQPTRGTSHSRSIIDHAISNLNDKVHSQILSLNECSYSDHKFLCIEICPDKTIEVNKWAMKVFKSRNRELFADKMKEQVELLLNNEHTITVENLVVSIV